MFAGRVEHESVQKVGITSIFEGGSLVLKQRNFTTEEVSSVEELNVALGVVILEVDGFVQTTVTIDWGVNVNG